MKCKRDYGLDDARRVKHAQRDTRRDVREIGALPAHQHQIYRLPGLNHATRQAQTGTLRSAPAQIVQHDGNSTLTPDVG
jgi:hypothetical protein